MRLILSQAAAWREARLRLRNEKRLIVKSYTYSIIPT